MDTDLLITLKELCKKRDISSIIDLITDHPEVLDEQDESGSSGFLVIAYGSLPEAFQKAKSLKREHTFHEAIVAGELEKVRKQLSSDGQLVHARSGDGFSPLSLAAFFNQNDIAEFLVGKGADPNLEATNPSRVNALHSAVARDNYDLCVLFVGHGADVNSVQMQNVSPLHSATHRGNLRIVKLLVENGADISHPMDNGDTALIIAEREGKIEVEEYLKSMLKNG